MKKIYIKIFSTVLILVIFALAYIFIFSSDTDKTEKNAVKSTQQEKNSTESTESKNSDSMSSEKKGDSSENNTTSKEINNGTSSNNTDTKNNNGSTDKGEIVATPENTTKPFEVNGIIVVNKKHPLPKTYNPGENSEARTMINKLISDAQAQGLDVSNNTSGFRSYSTQAGLYQNYVRLHGQAQADRFSARPGYSEHQSGLAFDLIDNEGQLLGADGTTASSKKAASWVAENSANYGFILRYKEEFESKTGYMAEAWHLRYVGRDTAKKIVEKNITLEEYLNVSGGDY